MKVAHIVPTSILHLTKWNDYHLILPHLLETDEAYRTFYQEEATGHKILDNGVAESVDFEWETLVRLGANLQVDEVVAPDVMGDCDRTIAACRAFGPLAMENPQVKYIGVVQGKTYSDLAKCLAFYETQEWVSVLALPRILCHLVHRDIRWNFVEAFAVQIENRFDAVHCLGASSQIKEALLLREQRLIRGIDTSMPAVMGLDKRLIDVDSFISRGDGFFEEKPNPKQLMCIEHNLELYVDWCR